MNNSAESIKITMYETQGCLVFPIQEELSKKAALQIQRSLLERVHEKSVKGVIIDLSGVKIIDAVLWEVFSKTAQMVKILGSPSVITGLSPGVVASIIDLNLIQSPHFIKSKSIFNKDFNYKRKRILGDGKDYDDN